MSDRIIDQGSDDAERVAELALRPKNLTEFVGQTRVRDQLNLYFLLPKNVNLAQITFYFQVHLVLEKLRWQ